MIGRARLAPWFSKDCIFGGPAAATPKALMQSSADVHAVAPTHALFREDEWIPIRQLLRLSPRESEIVLGMLAGACEAAIADRLGISSHTVHCHLTRLYRKLGVNSRPDLLIRVFDAHLTLTR